MEKQNEHGSLDLLRGRLVWGKDEPYWFKIVIVIIMGTVLIVMALTLRQWVIPTIAGSQLAGSKFLDVVKLIKGKSP